VEVDGERLVAEKLDRLIVGPDVERVPVRDAGLAATYFRPREARGRVGVVVLSGSDGGVPEIPAALLASHGYPALAVGYFGVEGLPEQLVEIPLEDLAKAAEWLRRQEGVDPERLVVLGASKGGEGALALTAHVPGFAGVVAYAPSGVVWQGLDLKQKRSSWTFQGQPLPFVPYRIPAPRLAELIWKGVRKQPIAFRPFYEASLRDSAAVERATISVERIAAPLLLISTSDDQVWPSKGLSEMVVRRRAAHGLTYPDEHLSFDGAGHLVDLPGAPTINTDIVDGMIFGGKPAARARAQAAAWDAVLRFLGRI
jgi:dienelactone hydrolase